MLFLSLSKNATVQKFNNVNGVVQRAVMAKRVMDRRSGGGRNRGIDGMIHGGGSWKQNQLALASLIQEVAMVQMRNWANQDTASVGYADEDESYDSYVDRNDRG